MCRLCCILLGWTAFVVHGTSSEKIGVYLGSDYSDTSVRIRSLDLDVELVGDRVVTLYDFVFYNDLERTLEGEFVLPLQEGQSVYRLALDIEGELREASLVGKSKGRQAFEQIVREQVDPALLENSAGNSYKLKVYPFPGKGTRRVQIGVEETIREEDRKQAYRLPFNFSGKIKRFGARIRSMNKNVPEVLLNGTPLQVVVKEGRYEAYFEAADFEGRGSLDLAINKRNRRHDRIQVEWDGKSEYAYFVGEINLKGLNKPSRNKKPEVLLLWDSSLSGERRMLAQEIELAIAYLKQLRGGGVELVCFGLDVRRMGRFDLSQAGLEKLKRALTQLKYDGATRWESLQLQDLEVHQTLIFSDGIVSLGKSSPLLPSARTFAVSSSENADHAFLESLCRDTGGTYLNLNCIETVDALKRLKGRSPRVRTWRSDGGAVSSLIHKQTENAIRFAGRTRVEKSDLIIDVELPRGSDRRIGFAIDPRIPSGNQRIVQREWASMVFNQMPVGNKEERKAAEAFAETEGIVTPVTSLIVLESIHDYLRFEVDPPASLLTEYRQLKKDDKEEIENRLEELVEDFKSRIAWYEASYPETPPPPSPGHSPSEETVATEPQTGIPPTAAVPPSTNEVLGSVEVTRDEGEVLFELSPFSVDASPDIGYTSRSASVGYTASRTLSATRIRTTMNDVGASADSRSSPGRSDAQIRLAEWTPEADYYQKLKNASETELEELYFDLRKEYGSMMAFYFDAAAIFKDKGLEDRSFEVLSNVVEISPHNSIFLRAAGRRFLQLGQHVYALDALEEAYVEREFEPQSYFDLALAHRAMGQNQEAINWLYQILDLPNIDRFYGVEMSAIMEINRILSVSGEYLDVSHVDPRLIYAMPSDFHVRLSWNTDDTDVDLWVTDPFGVVCSFQHALTAVGGLLSEDITEGYGPEEFFAKRAREGKYVIEADYYDSREQGRKLPVVLSLELTKNYGRSNEKTNTITLRVEKEEDVVKIGEAQFGELKLAVN